jgi:hypothetical protein
MLVIEEFKDLYIDGFETIYKVSSLGYIVNKERNKILKPFISKQGYMRVSIKIQGSKRSFSIHRLVAMTFIPRKSENLQVNHIDGNKHNNCVVNLEWITAYENIQHAYEHNLRKRPLNKLEVEKICELMVKGFGNTKIANLLDIPVTVIQAIRQGKTYTCFTKKFVLPLLVSKPKKLSIGQVHQICQLLADGESHKTIARIMDCNTSIIDAIYQRRSWKKISENYIFPPDYRKWKKIVKILDKLIILGLSTKEICAELSLPEEEKKHLSVALSKRRRVLANKGLTEMQRNK